LDANGQDDESCPFCIRHDLDRCFDCFTEQGSYADGLQKITEFHRLAPNESNLFQMVKFFQNPLAGSRFHAIFGVFYSKTNRVLAGFKRDLSWWLQTG
jgi:hypothetical protein